MASNSISQSVPEGERGRRPVVTGNGRRILSQLGGVSMQRPSTGHARLPRDVYRKEVGMQVHPRRILLAYIAAEIARQAVSVSEDGFGRAEDRLVQRVDVHALVLEPGTCCSPRHPTQFESPFLELNGIL